MTRKDGLSIGEVARASGLTERALRHYEKEGLLAPGRSSAGRRAYCASDLERLAEVAALKRAGFTISQMRALLKGRVQLAAIVDAQLGLLEAERAGIETAVRLLKEVRHRLAMGEALDAPTLCALIKAGEKTMEEDKWKKVLDRYYTPEEQAHWKAEKEKSAAMAGCDQAAYTKAWEDLASRIERALPLDPASEKAKGFVAEWNKLLEPFMKAATPQMKEGAARMWSKVEEWEGEVKSPISSKVAAFMREAMARARA